MICTDDVAEMSAIVGATCWNMLFAGSISQTSTEVNINKEELTFAVAELVPEAAIPVSSFLDKDGCIPVAPLP
ncbi:hypothetical protein EC973_006221 [Apophysomyces ossiformis]|uniref:Uncharacterized protein n=1 Tax=Apophysomyces ossiformis TaxID=679940 RepID=A0A8H7BJS1_9FUNG|nr:hypothetical protein EC973_006221 [Apophysomyces ossiformis]